MSWLTLLLGFLLSTLSWHAEAQFFPIGVSVASGGGGGGSGSATEVWSPTQINSNLSGGGTMIVTQTGTNIFAPAYGYRAYTTGKYYWELTTSNYTDAEFGIGNTSSSIANGQYLGKGFDTLGIFQDGSNIQFYINDASVFDAPLTISAGNVIGIALDLVNNLLWVSDVTTGSAWYGAVSSGDPASGTNGFSLTQAGFTIISNPVVPAIQLYANGDTGTGFFSSSSWLGTAPSGFRQLPGTPVQNGSSTAVFYSGTCGSGCTQTTTSTTAGDLYLAYVLEFSATDTPTVSLGSTNCPLIADDTTGANYVGIFACQNIAGGQTALNITSGDSVVIGGAEYNQVATSSALESPDSESNLSGNTVNCSISPPTTGNLDTLFMAVDSGTGATANSVTGGGTWTAVTGAASGPFLAFAAPGIAPGSTPTATLTNTGASTATCVLVAIKP